MQKRILDILQNTQKVIIGKERVTKLLLTALLADGHVLLEDVPGTGKTRLAKALAASLGIEFGRIQFTPDMLPADITGLHIYDRESGKFVLNKGPVFTNILLADEINRATPRTQAGLLECMEERQVTIDGKTQKLEPPFFVVATENPVETAGTFPLPEAQMDRFLMKLSMGLPTREEEVQILDTYMAEDPLKKLTAVIDQETLERMQKEAMEVYVHPTVRGYLADLSAATRSSDQTVMGVSPRGTIALMRASRAWAYLEGRSFVTPDDVKGMGQKELKHLLKERAAKAYEAKEAEFPEPEHIRELERVVLLKVIDAKWMDHIDDMDQLRQGIGLQAYGNRDPKIEYKMLGYDMFGEMTQAITETTVRTLMHVRIEQKAEREQVAKVTGTNKDDTALREPKKRENKKVYPNDPCPCGSGKKYKQCCGRNK